MNTAALPRMTPVLRLAFGLVSLAITLVLALDFFLDVVPDQIQATRELRKRVAESLGVHVALVMRDGEPARVGEALQEVLQRDRHLLSVAVRRAAGEIVAQRGDHDRHWVAPGRDGSTVDHIRVPLHDGRERWGDLEMSFLPAEPQDLSGWLRQPVVMIVAALATVGFLVFFLYMRRALLHLDPGFTVPERVRQAYDTLRDGIAILDGAGRVVLANRAFRQLHPGAAADLHGRTLADEPWLKPSLEPPGRAPWMQAMKDCVAVTDLHWEVVQPEGGALKVIVGCSPIHDGEGATRGCLVTFDDVTELHLSNERLLAALAELAASREQIEAQNEELRLMATRDPLTGCLNRRAFFDAVDALFGNAGRDSRIACIMCDIDYFKSFNDRYGHAVGDQVIQSVAHALGSGLRGEDILCRYGGEEFCIVLPRIDAAQATYVAERLRREIELHAGMAVRTTAGLQVTMSFGVAVVEADPARVQELVHTADNALYESKRAGRNRVTLWQ